MEQQRKYELKQQQKQEVKKCPNCGSYKTFSTKGYTVLAGIVIFSICGIIGLFFLPLLIGSLIGLMLVFIGIFMPAKDRVCLNCQYKWIVEKEDSAISQL